MKKLFASATVIAVALLTSVAIPSESQAAQTNTTKTPTIQPYAAQGCSGDTCIYLSTPSGGTVYVQGWAYSTDFYGYFRLTTPSGTYYSGTHTWLGGKGNWIEWSGLSAIVGQYCVTGFTSGGVSEGTACESVL